MDEHTAVIKRTDGQMSTRGVAFRSLDDICRFADLICKSSFVPRDMQGKAGDVVAAIAYGLELGLTPMAALQNIGVINGRPSVFGDMQLALVLNDPNCEYVHERESEEVKERNEGRCDAKRRGHDPVVRTFSIDDAKKAGLWGKSGPWSSYPYRMLQMRARSWCLRDAFPDTLKGLYAREEAQDIELLDVTPRFTTPEPTIVMEPQELRPTADHITSLVELARSCDVNLVTLGHYLRQLMQLSEETKTTKKFLRETMTMAQFEEAWAHYSEMLKKIVEEQVSPDNGEVVEGVASNPAAQREALFTMIQQVYKKILTLPIPRRTVALNKFSQAFGVDEVGDLSTMDTDSLQAGWHIFQTVERAETDAQADDDDVQDYTGIPEDPQEDEPSESNTTEAVTEERATTEPADTKDGYYASPDQIGKLRVLAQQVGDDASVDVQDMLDHHPEGLTVAVYDIVMDRLRSRRDATKVGAKP